MQVICYGSAPTETKPRNRGKLTKDGEEAKQRRDFRRNPMGAQEHTSRHSLASNQGSWAFVPPHPTQPLAMGEGG